MIIISSIVSQRDKRPYVQIDIDGRLVQLTIKQAHSIAQDILIQASRAEADAMIHKFFSASNFPKSASSALMLDFRNFRSKIDQEVIEKKEISPDRLGDKEWLSRMCSKKKARPSMR